MQEGMTMISNDFTYPAALAVTAGRRHHFFGYYDKFPWDKSGRYLLGLETTFIDRPPTPNDCATIGLIDFTDNNRWISLAETRAWNWQQGTMLQWLPTAPDRLIIYNYRDSDRFVSVIRDVQTGEYRTLPLPIYAVSRDGKSAVSLNFARLHQTRPGYGYTGLLDLYEDELHPDDDGIYWMDLNTGEHKLIISLAQIVSIRHNSSMDGSKHWFNHMLFNPDDTRFLFLHRWRRPDGGRWTRMFTANLDGSDIYCVADHEMVSHFDWRNPHQILAWARQHDIGDRYFLFTDQTNVFASLTDAFGLREHPDEVGEVEVVGEGILTTDGHCSYSPDGRWILTDTYPDRERKRTLILYRHSDGYRVDIGRFFAPKELDGEIRCDLHPRWSRDGQQVCIDSVHEGHRQIYVLDVAEIVNS